MDLGKFFYFCDKFFMALLWACQCKWQNNNCVQCTFMLETPPLQVLGLYWSVDVEAFKNQSKANKSVQNGKCMFAIRTIHVFITCIAQ